MHIGGGRIVKYVVRCGVFAGCTAMCSFVGQLEAGLLTT